ncbi:MAG: DUF2157 domain-containing protein [Dehalococcoidia bacterium]
MGRYEEHLSRWQEAGLIDSETAERVRDFEGARPATSERPTVIEAVVYLGLAVIGVGVTVLTASEWENLDGWARIAVPAFGAAVALGAGQLLAVQGSPALRRGAAVAWLLAVALIAATAAVVFDQSDARPERVAMGSGLVGAVAAVALWIGRPTHAALVAMAAPLMVFSIGIAAEDGGESSFSTFGLTLAGLGAVGVLLAELGWLTPRVTARVLTGLAVAFGAFYSGIGDANAWTQVLPFIAGAALIALSIRRGVFVYMAYGIGATFLGLVTVIVRNVGDVTVAAMLLIVIGVALLGGVLALAKFRPWASGGGEAAA